MPWRWIWVIKNRKGWYWNVESKKFSPKINKATIYAKEPQPIAMRTAQAVDFTAYPAKGTFDISEFA